MSEIAVVIPCFNMGRTIVETLDSVGAQTRPAADIVIVDDGSTDLYTRQLLTSLRRPLTRVVRTPNRGVAAARDHGIALTRAEYVFPLDADDLLDPTYFEKAAARLDGDPGLDFVGCGVQAFGEATYRWTPPPCDFVQHLVHGTFYPATMFRRRVWEAVGGFDASLPAHEDFDFWLSVLEKGFQGAVLDEPLLKYRVRRGSRNHYGFAAGTYRATMARIFDKHRASIERHAVDLLEAKDAFLREHRAHCRRLEQRKAELEAELATLRAPITALVGARRRAGRDRVDWGELRRLTPISPVWGLDRGKPVDRYYIEKFVEQHKMDIRGRVLEVKDPGYTKWFGDTRVSSEDVIDIDPSNPQATVVADLTRADHVPSDRFDCFILTQTLHIIYDVRAALTHAYRMLKPGGVLICTLPAVSRINYEDGGLDAGDYWRFTEASVRALFSEVFPVEAFQVEVFGNVLVCAAFLYGLAVDDLKVAELDHVDPWFPLLFAVRAVKPGVPAQAASCEAATSELVVRTRARERSGGAVLMYHRIASLRPDTHGMCVSAEEFRSQMEHLGRHYQPMGLEELVRSAMAGRIPERAVTVTLDDGYVDALEVASPILGHLGLPATFFVNSERLDQRHEFWWDTLERIFVGEVGALPTVLALHVKGERVVYQTVSVEDRTRAHTAVHRLMWHASRAERDELLAQVVDWSRLELTVRSTHRALLGAEIAQLASRPGHTVGGHTTHHLSLPAQPSSVQRQEILENKAELEALLGRPVLTFAYPFGELEPSTVALVRSASFLAAVTTRGGLLGAGDDPLVIPRHSVTARAGEDFARYMEQLFDR